MPADVIAIERLTKRYGARIGVQELSLTVPAGCVLGFLGPNGAGKTTTIRVLLGLLRPDAGRATVLGHDTWRQSPAAKRDIGYVPGDLRLWSSLNGRDALRLAGRTRGRDLTAAGQALGERLELDLTVRAEAMSRGMRQKLGLILALAHDPRLLVLDEPTTGLDPISQARLYELLRERTARGDTVFFSSHVLSEVQDLCERVVILRHGTLVADERLEALRERAGRAVTLRWADTPPTPPAFLALDQDRDSAWHAVLNAPVPDLLAWLHGKPVADLEIGPPDLDRVFRSYYADAPGAS